jgi:hypothetical protein
MRRLAMVLVLGAAASGGCLGHIGGDGDAAGSGVGTGTSPFTCNPEAARLTPAPIRRLAKEYVKNALAELLSQLDDGSRAALLASLQTRLDLLPADDSDHYQNNDAKISQEHVDAMFGVALALGVNVSADAGYASEILRPCGSGLDATALDDDGCLTTFVTYYGRKALRRPPTAAEIDGFKAFHAEAEAQAIDALAALLGRFVAHPAFYYRFDGDGDVVAGTEGVDAVHRLTRWELLSKVTFLFWASPPSDALYDLVEASDVTQDAELAALVDVVLADPKAERGILGFYGEWLELDKTLSPRTDGNLAAIDGMIAGAGLGELPATHRDDMNREVLDLAKHYTLSTDGTVDDLLTSPYSFARTPALATIYGVSPWDGSPDSLVELPPERAGLLTRAAFVATNSEYSRPVIKGKRIRTQLLCTDIPPPPPDLEIEPLVHAADTTTRAATTEATADERCMSCHQHMNPLGFTSENFDAIGRLRATELRWDETGAVVAELPVDTEATVSLQEGQASQVSDAVELAELLAGSGQVHTCMVRNYFELVTGRSGDPEADGCDLVGLQDALAGDGGTIRKMLVASVMQPSFRQRLVK